MANKLYSLGRNKFARGDINWLAGGFPANRKNCGHFLDY